MEVSRERPHASIDQVQVVWEDVRNLPATLVQTFQQAPWTATELWHLRLAEVCNKALVSHRLEKAVEVAVAF